MKKQTIVLLLFSLNALLFVCLFVCLFGSIEDYFDMSSSTSSKSGETQYF